MGSTASDTRSDADLVAAALDGDRGAFGAIYDRYASTVFSVCSQMLANRDDAEDVTADVFLVAAERLGQLRDPSRLRYWLLSIARRNVYRRSSARSRTAVVAEVDTVTDALVTEDRASGDLEDAELVSAVRDAADGLDEGDRMVLELTLQGCEGSDLADVLGVSPNTASQAASRMRSRLERSLGALFVARQGREDCSELRGVLADWDGAFSVLWRKRVARHVDGCSTCEDRARRVPAVLLQGLAGAAPAVTVPISLRERVLDGARVGVSTEAPWSDSGFPRADAARRSWRKLAAVVGGLVVAAVALVIGSGVVGGDDAPTTTSTSTSSPTSSSTSTPPPTTVPTTIPAPSSVAPATTQPPTSDPPTPTVTTGPGRPDSGSTSDSGSGGGSGGGADEPSTGGTPTVPPTRPPRTDPPRETAPPTTAPPGGFTGPRPPRFSGPFPTLADPGRGGGVPVIP